MKKTAHTLFQFPLIRCIFLVTLSFGSTGLFAQSSDSAIFKDYFNRIKLGDFWEADPSWSIADGSAYSFIDGTGGKLRTAKGYNKTSYVIETTAHGFINNYMREYRITFGQADLSNDSMYVLSYTPYNGGRLTLSKSDNNIYFPQTLDEAVIYPQLNTTDRYKFKIARYKSGLIQVYVDKGAGYDNTPFLEAIDESYEKAGHIGWQIDTQSFAESFYVDDISAIQPAREKPAVKEKTAEDDLITQVSAKSGKKYQVAKLDSGVKAYIDRGYRVTSVPAYLKGASFVQSAMDDKKNISDTFLTLFVKKPSIIYIGYDSRAASLPGWLSTFTKTGDSIGTSDSKSGYLQVYSKLVEYAGVYPSPLLLGGNLASGAAGSEMNYIVAAVVRPEVMNLQAEDASLSGAVAAKDHPGYNGTGFVDFIHTSADYIEWTAKIDVPGLYNLGFNYTNGSNTDRSLDLTNNGTFIQTVEFSSTSSWSWWGFYSGVKVFLTPGIHKIRVTATGTSGPNIDELSLYYASSCDNLTEVQKTPESRGLISRLSDESLKAYPNPFVQSTKVSYSLREKAKVVLSVYSQQGQRVQILVNSIQGAGNYQAVFNAAKLLAGTYYYQLQAGNEVKVGKVLKQ